MTDRSPLWCLRRHAVAQRWLFCAAVFVGTAAACVTEGAGSKESVQRFLDREGYDDLRTLVCDHYAEGGGDRDLDKRIDSHGFTVDEEHEIVFAIAVVASDCRDTPSNRP